MTLTPNSESLREYNPCHDPQTGEFSSSRHGRCGQGIAQWRHVTSHRVRLGRADRRARRQGDVENEMALMYAEERVRARRGAHALPPHLRKDAAKALKNDRAVVIMDSFIHDRGRSSAHTRTVRLGSSRLASKPEALTVLRHEIGHVNPRKINSWMVVGLRPDTLLSYAKSALDAGPGTRLDAKAIDFTKSYVEEVRAWRNAIKDSQGKVSSRVMRRSLRSYTDSYFGEMSGHVFDTTIRTLSRYQRMVRRAARRKAAA